MARFFATIQGNYGMASRMGTTASGISAHPRGWDIGVHVWGHDDNGEDVFEITATGGSNGHASRYLGRVRLVDGQPMFEPHKQED